MFEGRPAHAQWSPCGLLDSRAFEAREEGRGDGRSRGWRFLWGLIDPVPHMANSQGLKKCTKRHRTYILEIQNFRNMSETGLNSKMIAENSSVN